jgi:hypothetical protein
MPRELILVRGVYRRFMSIEVTSLTWLRTVDSAPWFGAVARERLGTGSGPTGRNSL